MASQPFAVDSQPLGLLQPTLGSQAVCALCSQGSNPSLGMGPLLGPLHDDGKAGGADVFVHRQCAVWSAEARAAAQRSSPPRPLAAWPAAATRAALSHASAAALDRCTRQSRAACAT